MWLRALSFFSTPPFSALSFALGRFRFGATISINVDALLADVDEWLSHSPALNQALMSLELRCGCCCSCSRRVQNGKSPGWEAFPHVYPSFRKQTIQTRQRSQSDSTVTEFYLVFLLAHQQKEVATRQGSADKKKGRSWINRRQSKASQQILSLLTEEIISFRKGTLGKRVRRF